MEVGADIVLERLPLRSCPFRGLAIDASGIPSPTFIAYSLL